MVKYWKIRVLLASLSFLSLAGLVAAQQNPGIAGPSSVAFGDQPVGTGTCCQQVTLQNKSQFAIIFTSVTVAGNFGESDNCSGAIAFAQHCTMSISFTPTSPANLTGSVTIKYKEGSGSTIFTAIINLSGTGVSPGYINPKYVVVAVVYAPPGSNSNVNYSTSNLVSSTATVTHTFINSVTQSVSVTTPGGLFGFLGGTRSSSFSNTLTQQNQDSTSVTASFTDTSSLQLFGPGANNNCGPEASDFIGVDHNCDLIKVWVNPVMLFTVRPSGVQWNGYGSSELDNVAPIHIVDVLVGCLNGHLAANDSRCAPPLGEFQRTWAANENWPSGEGPGLTATDLNNILAADPWGQCAANAAIGSSACPTFSTPGFVLLPPQFTLSDKQNIPYHQGAPGTGYMVSTTSSTTQSQESKTTHDQKFGYEDSFKGSGFLSGFQASLSKMQTLTTAYEVENKTTVASTFTGMANITPPACNGNPCNPPYPPSPQTYGQGTEFDIFVDNFFGTFAFVPSAYN